MVGNELRFALSGDVSAEITELLKGEPNVALRFRPDPAAEVCRAVFVGDGEMLMSCGSVMNSTGSFGEKRGR